MKISALLCLIVVICHIRPPLRGMTSSIHIQTDQSITDKTLLKYLKESTAASEEDLLEALAEVNVNTTQNNIFQDGCLESGYMLGKPLGELFVDFLKASKKKNNTFYELVANVLLDRFFVKLKEYYKYRWGTRHTLISPEIIAKIPHQKINQQGESGRSFLMCLLNKRIRHRAMFEGGSANTILLMTTNCFRDYVTPLVYNFLGDIVKKLLENSADPTLQDNEGRTALHFAVYEHNVAACEMLLEAGPPLIINVPSQSMPLHRLICGKVRTEGNEGLLRKKTKVSKIQRRRYSQSVNICKLFQKKGFDFNSKDVHGNTLLHQSVGEDYDLSDFLLRNGAYIDETNKLGQTSLHRACIENEDIYIDLFSFFKASLKIRDLFGNAPIFYACISGVDLKFLPNNMIEDKFARNFSGWSLLHVAAYFDNVEAALFLIFSMPDEQEVALLINGKINTSGKTPLMIAAEKGHTKFCKTLLLQPTLDKNARDPLVGTALDWAFEFEQVEVAPMLFEKGFAHNLDEESKTRLMLRACQAEFPAQRLLLNLVQTTWSKWGTVLKIAESKGYYEVVSYLHEAQRVQDLDLSESLI